MDRTVTFKQEETSGHEPQPGLDRQTDWPSVTMWLWLNFMFLFCTQRSISIITRVTKPSHHPFDLVPLLRNPEKRTPPSTGYTPRLTCRSRTHWRWLYFLNSGYATYMMTLISSCLGLMHLRTPLQVHMTSLPRPKMTRYPLLVLGPYLMRICFTRWHHVRNTRNPVPDDQVVNLP
jgi:hypothetical protein